MNLDPRTRFKVAVLKLRIAALKYRAFARREPGSRSGVVQKRRLLECVVRSIRMSAVDAKLARREASLRCTTTVDGGSFDWPTTLR
jgi:hypothetical protein